MRQQCKVAHHAEDTTTPSIKEVIFTLVILPRTFNMTRPVLVNLDYDNKMLFSKYDDF